MPTQKMISFDDYIPSPKESKTEKSEREKRFKQDFKNIFDTIQNQDHNVPSSWKDSLSPECSPKNLDALSDMITIMPTALSNPSDISELSNLCGNILMATIATGQKGQITLIHSLDQVGPKTVALHGTSSTASALEIDQGRLLESKNHPVPSLESIANLSTNDATTYKSKDNEETTISNTICFPPDFNDSLLECNNKTAEEILPLFLSFCQNKDEENGIETYCASEEDDIEDDEGDAKSTTTSKMLLHEDSCMHKYKQTIKTLYKWSTNSRAISSCTIPSDETGIQKWSEQKHNTLALKQSNPIKNSVSFDDETPQKKSLLDSPTKKHPAINLTGNNSLQTDQIPTNLEDKFKSNENETNANGTFSIDGGDLILGGTRYPLSKIMECIATQQRPPSHQDPFTPPNKNQNQQHQQHQQQQSQQQSQQQTQQQAQQQTQQQAQQQTQQQTQQHTQQQPNLSCPQGLMHQALIQLVNATEKANETNERLADSHEAMVKMKEDSSKNKISTPTSDFLKNIFTKDGINPRSEIPTQIKEFMTTTADTTATNLDLILNKEKTPAKPLVSFVKALHKGIYHYETGHPGGLTPMAIPNTLAGSSQENTDIRQLLAAEANKDDISSQEKKILNSNGISPPRTINYALKELKAYASVIKQGGDDTLLFLVLEDFVSWLEENEQVLSENAATFDKHLPTKIVYTVGDAINNFFKCGRYRVPEQTWIDFNDLKQRLLSNQHYITLPPNVMKTLEPKRKRDDSPSEGDSAQQDEERKKRFVVEKHNNQPIQIKCSKEMHRAVINNLMWNPGSSQVETPKHNGEDECLRYCYLGYCTSSCMRKKNHKPVHNGSARFKALLDFRKKAVEHYNKTKSPEDPNFS